MGIRLIHDKQASAAAATRCFVWLPREGRNKNLSAGIELNEEDLDTIILALNARRTHFSGLLRTMRRTDPDASDALLALDNTRSSLRQLEGRLAKARDDLHNEQRWRGYEAQHPAPPRR